APARVRRQWLGDLDASPTVASIQTRETEFGDMYLMEVARGCGRGCRFCAAGYLYLPARERSLESLEQQAARGLSCRQRIGLVGAAVSDYSHLEELSGAILAQGGGISLASVRIDSLTAAEVEALAASGHKTLALAPEAGSQRLRDAINKQIDRDQILRAVDLLGAGGIANIKLYLMVGLPGESEEDLVETEELIRAIHERWRLHGRERGRMGRIILSVNPFIPKPATPLQWCGMAQRGWIKQVFRRLRSLTGSLANTELNVESPRQAELQALLARGDRRMGELLPLLSGGMPLQKACEQLGIAPHVELYADRDLEAPLPWDTLDTGVQKSVLVEEYRRYQLARTTPGCRPDCRRCGVCG
ncbi:MAG: radical SAM protein, partial [Deltaproteobacteria bacterium]